MKQKIFPTTRRCLMVPEMEYIKRDSLIYSLTESAFLYNQCPELIGQLRCNLHVVYTERMIGSSFQDFIFCGCCDNALTIKTGIPAK